MHGTGLVQAHPSLLQKRAPISVQINPSKLLQTVDRPLASQSSFEGIIGTDIHASFMASLPVMLDVGVGSVQVRFFSTQILQRKGRGNRHGYGWL